MKISLVSIFVADPIKAFKFYTEVLGFNEKMYMPEMFLAIVTAPDAPDGTAILLEPNKNLGAADFQKAVYDAGLPWIVFGTENIQKDYEKLTAKGVKFQGPPKKEEWGTLAVFDDTFGNWIQLHQA